MKQLAHICNKRETPFPELLRKHKLTYGQVMTRTNLQKHKDLTTQSTTLIVLTYQPNNKLCLKQARLGTYTCQIDRWVFETFLYR